MSPSVSPERVSETRTYTGRPVAAIAVLLCLTGAFRTFDLFYVMVGPSRTPLAEVAATWIIKSAFKFKELGYAAAMAT